MSAFTEKLRYEWSRSGIILQLLIINLVVFILLNLSANFNWRWIGYFAMPMGWEGLVHRPWTVITSMFSHEDFSHIFYNMIWFYVFGRIFVDVTGFHHWTKITFVYIFGGLLGAVFLTPLFLMFPDFFGSYALGASGAVMSIALAVGFFVPDYKINFMLVGEIKIKWVVAFVFVTSTLIDLSDNVGGKVDHLGGAVFGTIYGLSLRNGRDLSAWFTRLLTKKRGSKLKVVHSRKTRTDYEYAEYRHEEEKTLDELLDKINRSGYESLSRKEKETLHVLSKKK
jgi:membrane associated rhomboid family serine protease